MVLTHGSGAIPATLTEETIGIEIFQRGQAEAVRDRRASAATIADRAFPASRRPEAIPFGLRRFINLKETHRSNVPDRRGELAASMDFPVGQQRDEIKGGAAARPGAAGQERASAAMADDIEQIVLEPEDAVSLGRLDVLLQKFEVVLPARRLHGRGFAGPGKPVERETVGQVSQMPAQGDDVREICFREREHDMRLQSQVLGVVQKCDHALEVSESTNGVVIGLQPFQAHLVVQGLPDGEESLDIIPRDGVSQNGDRKASPGDSFVELPKERIQERISPREADSAFDPLAPAERFEKIEHAQGLVERQLTPVGPVVAVLATKRAGIRQVPLQREHAALSAEEETISQHLNG